MAKTEKTTKVAVATEPTESQNLELPDDLESFQALQQVVLKRIDLQKKQKRGLFLKELEAQIDVLGISPQELIKMLIEHYRWTPGPATRKSRARNAEPKLLTNPKKIYEGFVEGATYGHPKDPEKRYIGKKQGRVPIWVVEHLEEGMTWNDLQVAAPREGQD